MKTRVLHQEYLQMWLDGEELERKYLNYEWNEFDGEGMTLDSFDDENYEFRKKLKVVKVDIDKLNSIIWETYVNSSAIETSKVFDLINECIVED